MLIRIYPSTIYVINMDYGTALIVSGVLSCAVECGIIVHFQDSDLQGISMSAGKRWKLI